MHDEFLQSSICTALMRLGTRMATEFDQRFARFGITQAQFRVLLAVLGEGGVEGIAPSVLADHLFLERATVSVLTNRLVERGWLARSPGANRRSFRLMLTEEGEGRLRQVLPHAVALADETLIGYGLDDLRQMHAALERLEARLRTMVTAPHQGEVLPREVGGDKDGSGV